MGRLVIMRGLPGSGKTTRAREIAAGEPGALICSADEFWWTDSGRYAFDGGRYSEAHEHCRSRVATALRLGTPLIVVDNTHVRWLEVEIYRWMGMVAGYEVHIEDLYDGGLTAPTLRQRTAEAGKPVPVDAIQLKRDQWENI